MIAPILMKKPASSCALYPSGLMKALLHQFFPT